MSNSRPARSKLSSINLSTRGVPVEYFDSHLEEYPFDPEVKQAINAYVTHFDDMLKDFINLLLFGANGTGKTYLTSYIVKEAYRFRYTSYRVTLAYLVDLYFRKGKKEPGAYERWEDLMECEFLVIDEVGKESFDSKGYNISIFEETLRTRHTFSLPFILCTNLPLSELYAQYGASVESLIDGTTAKFEFTGKDNRKAKTSRKKGMRILSGEED